MKRVTLWETIHESCALHEEVAVSAPQYVPCRTYESSPRSQFCRP